MCIHVYTYVYIYINNTLYIYNIMCIYIYHVMYIYIYVYVTYHIISYHSISYHIISYHIISYHTYITIHYIYIYSENRVPHDNIMFPLSRCHLERDLWTLMLFLRLKTNQNHIKLILHPIIHCKFHWIYISLFPLKNLGCIPFIYHIIPLYAHFWK